MLAVNAARAEKEAGFAAVRIPVKSEPRADLRSEPPEHTNVLSRDAILKRDNRRESEGFLKIRKEPEVIRLPSI